MIYCAVLCGEADFWVWRVDANFRLGNRRRRKMRDFEPSVAFKIPTDSQVLIVKRDFREKNVKIAEDETTDNID